MNFLIECDAVFLSACSLRCSFIIALEQEIMKTWHDKAPYEKKTCTHQRRSKGFFCIGSVFLKKIFPV